MPLHQFTLSYYQQLGLLTVANHLDTAESLPLQQIPAGGSSANTGSSSGTGTGSNSGAGQNALPPNNTPKKFNTTSHHHSYYIHKKAYKPSDNVNAQTLLNASLKNNAQAIELNINMPKAAKLSIKQVAEKAFAANTSITSSSADDHNDEIDTTLSPEQVAALEQATKEDDDTDFSYPPPAPEGFDEDSDIHHLYLTHLNDDSASNQPQPSSHQAQPENAAAAYQQLVYGSFKQPLGNSGNPLPGYDFTPTANTTASSTSVAPPPSSSSSTIGHHSNQVHATSVTTTPAVPSSSMATSSAAHQAYHQQASHTPSSVSASASASTAPGAGSATANAATTYTSSTLVNATTTATSNTVPVATTATSSSASPVGAPLMDTSTPGAAAESPQNTQSLNLSHPQLPGTPNSATSSTTSTPSASASKNGRVPAATRQSTNTSGQFKSEDCPICHRNFKGPKASTHKQQHIRRLHPAHYIPKRGGKKRATDQDSQSPRPDPNTTTLLTSIAQQANLASNSYEANQQ